MILPPLVFPALTLKSRSKHNKILTFFHCLVAEKNLRGLEAQLAVQQKKVEEHVVMLGDYEAQNKRTATENAMLFTK